MKPWFSVCASQIFAFVGNCRSLRLGKQPSMDRCTIQPKSNETTFSFRVEVYRLFNGLVAWYSRKSMLTLALNRKTT